MVDINKNALMMTDEELKEFRSHYGIVPFDNPKRSFKTLARYSKGKHLITLYSEKEVRDYRYAMKKFNRKIIVEKIGDCWIARRA